MGRINKRRRYVIGSIVLNPLSLGELGGGVQCFGEFGASRRARTMKIGRRVRERGSVSGSPLAILPPQDLSVNPPLLFHNLSFGYIPKSLFV